MLVRKGEGVAPVLWSGHHKTNISTVIRLSVLIFVHLFADFCSCTLSLCLYQNLLFCCIYWIQRYVHYFRLVSNPVKNFRGHSSSSDFNNNDYCKIRRIRSNRITFFTKMLQLIINIFIIRKFFN